MKKLGKQVISNDIGTIFYKGFIAEIVESTDINLEESETREKEKTILTETSSDIKKIFNKIEKKINGRGINKAEKAAAVEAIEPKTAAFYDEVKHYMDGSRGHGYAAEYGNNTMDRLAAKDVESAAQKLDDHGRQVKHGADRLVNNVEIQTKYYKTASETIGAVFEHRQAIYIRSDGSEKMMQIEVPRDQYHDALIEMQKRIDGGQVPNVVAGEDATNYVRRGFFTYEQSFNIAKGGTIESLSVDAASGVICCMQAASISSIIIFAQAMWRGESLQEAMKESLQSSLVIMGKGTFIYTMTMQLSRKEFANLIAGKAFTVDGISQGFQGISNPIYTLSENVALKVNASGIASTDFGKAIGLDNVTGRQLIGGSVTVAIVFGPDIVRTLQGKISTKQLFKNSVIGVAGMGGAVVGQMVIPIPVVGAMVGGTVAGVVSKKTMDYFIEDDAKEMFRILKEEFIDQTMLFSLTAEEFDEVVKLTVGNKKLTKMLQSMFKSEDYRAYARESIMIPAVFKISKNRKRIKTLEYKEAFRKFAIESENSSDR